MIKVDVEFNMNVQSVELKSIGAAKEGMRELSQAIVDHVRQMISDPYPPSSSPGSPPHMRTGKLLKGMQWTEGHLAWFIFSDATRKGGVNYQKFLEPPGWANRPHLVRGAQEVIKGGLEKFFKRKI